jgi:hypothetical protein
MDFLEPVLDYGLPVLLVLGLIVLVIQFTRYGWWMEKAFTRIGKFDGRKEGRDALDALEVRLKRFIREELLVNADLGEDQKRMLAYAKHDVITVLERAVQTAKEALPSTDELDEK